MKKSVLFLLAALVLSIGCELQADNSRVVPLTGSEKQQVVSIVEQRQQIAMQRSELGIKYQSDMNRLNERDNEIGLAAQKLCFSLKKAHSLAANTNYALDEWKGQLTKQ